MLGDEYAAGDLRNFCQASSLKNSTQNSVAGEKDKLPSIHCTLQSAYTAWV